MFNRGDRLTMNKFNETREQLVKKGYGEHRAKLGNGVEMVYTNLSPIQRIENIGKEIRSKERIAKANKKELSYVKGLELRKKIEETIQAIDKEFGNNFSKN